MQVHDLFENRLPDVIRKVGGNPLAPGVALGFDIEGAGRWQIVGTNDVPCCLVSAWDGEPLDCMVTCSEDAFWSLLAGGIRGARAYASGKAVLEGDIGLLLRLRDVLQGAL